MSTDTTPPDNDDPALVLQALQRLFPDAERLSTGEYCARCPAHDASETFLVVFYQDGTINSCASGRCKDSEILAAAEGVPAHARRDVPPPNGAADDLAPAPARQHAILPLTDTGNAERLVAQHGSELRYCDPWKKWLVWDGARWKLDDTLEVMRRTKATVRKMYGEAEEIDNEDVRKSVAAWARKSEGKDKRTAMLALAAAENGIQVLPSQLDADPMLLNVLSGSVDLRTGELRAHRREDGITKLAPVTFDPAARCPTWDQFLHRITAGSAELIGFLQRTAGYALTGDVGAHALFFLNGAGANGKSTYLNTLSRLLGDYAVKAPAEILLTARGERHSTDKTMLHGARLAVCQEVNEGRRFDLAAVKGLTGGDPITARRMREDNWTWNPTHKLFLATNSKPRVPESDEATWRRIQLIPFEVTIPEAERDPALPEKLAAELPGILNWAIAGCVAWRRAGCGLQGLGAPERVREATKSYLEQEDLVGSFVQDRCLVSPVARALLGELYAAFHRWCEEAREQPLGKNAFNEYVERHEGVRKGKSNGCRVWFGISLRTAPTQTELKEVARA